MFENPIIDIAIGLALIYCLYSLFVTIINEIIASAFSLRAQMLKHALRRMLTDDENIFKNVFNKIFKKEGNKNEQLGNKLFKDFLDHPLVKYMSSGILYKIPSYISPENFSKVLTDILKKNNITDVSSLLKDETKPEASGDTDKLIKKDNSLESNSDTVKLIISFINDANNDLNKFKKILEKWFNDTMDRASGWYKRQAQLIILISGLIISLAFNVNTFEIVSYLSKDKTAREQIVNIAENYVKDRQIAVSDTNTAKRLDSLVIAAHEMYKTDIEPISQIVFAGWRSWDDFTTRFFDSFLGCLVTALAISLGAPFWFDLLNKLVKIRGTGNKPSDDKNK
jgi:CRISPR/Cas system CMR-associated protein Cmr5 small subunit